MTIDQAYRTCLYIYNKNKSGTFTGQQFNLLAPIAQLEVLGELLGNEQLLNERGVPPYGYGFNRKIDTYLKPLLTQPVTITVLGSGLWDYPEGFIWPDAVYKSDFTKIRVVDEDQFAAVKQNTIHPPTAEYPVIVLRNGQGYCDPNSLASFKMTYLKKPDDPYWAYTVSNDEQIYTGSGSVDFQLHYLVHPKIVRNILKKVGINLSLAEVTMYMENQDQIKP
jgi:hypothetical protein